jgi:hypothetical protein
MSTKTTFKRVALVAVAALGLGVLSVAPSSADVSGVTVTVTNGTATTMNSDSTTAASIKVQFLALAGVSDSVTVAISPSAQAPTGATVTAANTRLMFSDSTTSIAATYARIDTTSINVAFDSTKQAQVGAAYAATLGAHIHAPASGGANGTYSATLKFSLGETTTQTLVAGTYSYNAIVTSQSTAVGAAPVVQVVPFSIVVSDVEAASTVANAAYTDAFLGTTSPSSADVAGISALATASTTAAAYLSVYLKNSSNVAGLAKDTITVSISGPGLVYDGSSYGKSLTGYQTGTKTYSIVPDGNAGVSTVTVTTTKSALNKTKTVNFYAKAAKTITASVAQPVLAAGANTGAVAVVAVDSNGNPWTGSAYIVASSATDALVAGSTTPVACAAYNTTDGILCPVTALTVGTAKFKVIDAATVADATATSNEVTVTVKGGTASSVKLAFDKATYAPNEKALITVTPLDSTGSALQGKVFANLLATGGITATSAFATGSMDSLTAVSYTTSATSGTNKTAGSYTFVVYMPAASGDVTISATGGTDLPAAAQVKVTATATVVNASVDAATDAANEATDAANAATDAALAAADAADAATAAAQDASDAVAALSATVAKLVASLKAQITSLTNLVIKIQKKVRA